MAEYYLQQKKLNDILIQVNIWTIICQQLFGGLSGDEKEKKLSNDTHQLTGK